MLPEKFKVAAVVKDQKPALVGIGSVHLIHAGQPLTQPGAPADHLPELRLGAHLFEEHQIDAFRDINAGIHHIHRDGNVRLFFRLLEVVNDGLCIGVVADDPLGKGAVVLGIELIEPLQNKLRMALVLDKDDGFPQPVTARHFYAPLHQVLEHNVHRCLVEYELIERRRGDEVRHHAVLHEILLIPLLVLVGQVVIGDALV